MPGLEKQLRLEGETDGAHADIRRGWRIKIKEDKGSSFWLRIYQDVSQQTCYQCSCLGWGKEPHGLSTACKYHVV
eukprot:SAG22_NODE_10720_length_519_cov_1.616667_2_plen_74_part_01